MKREKNIPCVCFSVNVTIDNCSSGSKKSQTIYQPTWNSLLTSALGHPNL